jgi:hypothetical protein
LGSAAILIADAHNARENAGLGAAARRARARCGAGAGERQRPLAKRGAARGVALRGLTHVRVAQAEPYACTNCNEIEQRLQDFCRYVVTDGQPCAAYKMVWRRLCRRWVLVRAPVHVFARVRVCTHAWRPLGLTRALSVVRAFAAAPAAGRVWP